jgi:hypothetical protein
MLILYFIIDQYLTIRPLFLGGVVLVYGGFLLFFRWGQIGFYNKQYMNFTLGMEIILCCFAINNVLIYFLPSKIDQGIGLT